MKVIAINGSPRKNGNSSILIQKVLEELHREGIETEVISLSGHRVRGCTACMGCYVNKNQRCVFDDDLINECIEKMVEADGMILASPTYFADITPELKSMIDRVGLVSKANGDFLKRKLGAAVIAVRRGGAVHAFDSINHFFLISQMIVVGANYWNFAFGLNEGDVKADTEGLLNMYTLGVNFAWLLRKIQE